MTNRIDMLAGLCDRRGHRGQLRTNGAGAGLFIATHPGVPARDRLFGVLSDPADVEFTVELWNAAPALIELATAAQAWNAYRHEPEPAGFEEELALAWAVNKLAENDGDWT